MTPGSKFMEGLKLSLVRNVGTGNGIVTM